MKNAIEFAAVRAHGQTIQASDLPPEIVAAWRHATDTQPSAAEERARTLSALEAAQGNRTEAARLLGISRATLYRRLTESCLSSVVGDDVDSDRLTASAETE